MIHNITLSCMGTASVLFRIKSKAYCYKKILTAKKSFNIMIRNKFSRFWIFTFPIVISLQQIILNKAKYCNIVLFIPWETELESSYPWPINSMFVYIFFFFFIRMTTIYETFYDIGYTLQFILDHIKLFPFLEATEKSMKTK